MHILHNIYCSLNSKIGLSVAVMEHQNGLRLENASIIMCVTAIKSPNMCTSKKINYKYLIWCEETKQIFFLPSIR